MANSPHDAPGETVRIGELLVHEGQLTGQQLAKALQVQGLLGSRLGTNLLEEGLVTEAALLEAVGRQRSTRTVSGSELAAVPPEVVRMIPERLAERYGVVPFHLKGRTLLVASKDAGDLLKEDEIGFLTSCMVRTCIGLEFRIHEALTRYYRIKCPQRLLALVRRFALQAKAPREPPAAARGAGEEPPRKPSAGSGRHVRSRVATPHAVASATKAPAAKAPPPPARRVQPRFIELDAEDAALLGTSSSDDWTPSADEPVVLEPTPLPWLARAAARAKAGAVASEATARPPATAETATPAAPIPPAAAPIPPAAEAAPAEDDVELDIEEGLRQAAARLRDVEIRDDIADVLLAFCRPHFHRRLILVNRKHHIVGWRGDGDGVERDRLREIDIPAHDPSVFLGLTGTGSFWLGALPPLDANQILVGGLGGAPPKECVVLPVILRSRVVCYLYGDNLDAGVAGAPIAELRRLAAKAGLAFEVYILKNKLRML